MKIQRIRSDSGSLATLGFVAMVPLMMAIGAFAVDFMHYNSSMGELQKACDAGALAGANLLYQYEEPAQPGPPAVLAGPQNCENAARAVARLNPSDGRPVDDNDPEMMVDVTYPTIPAAPNVAGSCRVTATSNVKSIWATLFGNFQQTMSASATAGPMPPGATISAGGLFPLSIALGSQLTDNTTIDTHNVGDVISMKWQGSPNDPLMWTGFTTPSASQVRTYIQYYRDPSATPSQKTPAVTIGSDNVTVSNGVQATNMPALNALAGKIIFMPILQGAAGPGSHLLVGVLALKVTGITGTGAGSTLTGTLVRTTIGSGGPPAVFVPPTLGNLAPNSIKLIQ